MGSVPNNLELYQDRQIQWWSSAEQRFRSLRNVAQVRLRYLRTIFDVLDGKEVLDLGCGGGFLSIPLAELGANVLGVDQSQAAIEQAQQQAGLRGCSRRFQGQVADIRSLALLPQHYDLVVLADVVEHLRDYADLVARAAAALKPNGFLLVSTLNRNWICRLLAVWVSETLRLIPPGTHDWRLFVTPRELEQAVCSHGLQLHRLQGESPRIVATLCTWSLQLQPGSWTGASYTMIFRKDA